MRSRRRGPSRLIINSVLHQRKLSVTTPLKAGGRERGGVRAPCLRVAPLTATVARIRLRFESGTRPPASFDRSQSGRWRSGVVREEETKGGKGRGAEKG
jgi:hypothetical protein